MLQYFKQKRQNGRMVVQLYFQSIIEIIQDKPVFVIPTVLYWILISIYFHQMAGYVLSHYEREPLKDMKIGFIAYMNEFSTGTFLLFYKGTDWLTLIFFVIMNLIIYFYFMYVGVITYLKNFKQDQYIRNVHLIRKINQTVNIFFIFYGWIFLTPFIEINAGMVVCGQNSFLISLRDSKDCSDHPMALLIVGWSGIVLSLATGCIQVFFFRSYEFHELNKLRRGFHPISFLLVFLRVLTIYLYYLDLSEIIAIKHILSHIIGISILWDYYVNMPFSDQTVNTFYVSYACFFEMQMVFTSLLIFGKIIEQADLFYPVVFLSSSLAGGLKALWNKQKNKILHSSQAEFLEYQSHLDLYLEEVIFLTNQSMFDQEIKFKMIEVLIWHLKNCIDKLCHCKQLILGVKNSQFNQNDVFLVVHAIFRLRLEQENSKMNQTLIQHLTLKYISFISDKRNNSIRAYYELKVILSKQTSHSFYFQAICKIIGKQIEFQIDRDNQAREGKFTFNQRRPQELDMSTVLHVFQIQAQAIPLLSKVVEHQMEFWFQLQMGFKTIDDMEKFSVETVGQVMQLDKNITDILSEMKYDTEKTVFIRKAQILYELYIQNDITRAIHLQKDIVEMLFIQTFQPKDNLNNYSMIQNHVAILLISFVKDRGRILNPKTYNLAEFFGYQYQDFDQINSINQLMPKLIGNIHNDLMFNACYRGYTILYKNARRVFIETGDGFIQPVRIQVSDLYLSFDDYIQYGSLTRDSQENSYIIFDVSGRIMGITKGLFKKIFQHDNISVKELMDIGNIFLIFPELIEIMFENIEIIKKEDKTEEITDTFLINNLTSYVGLLDRHYQDIFSHFQEDLDEDFFNLESNQNSKFHRKQTLNISSYKKIDLTSTVSDKNIGNNLIKYLKQIKQYYIMKRKEINQKMNLTTKRQLHFNFTLNFNKLFWRKKAHQMNFFVFQVSEVTIAVKEPMAKKRLQTNIKAQLQMNQYNTVNVEALGLDTKFQNENDEGAHIQRGSELRRQSYINEKNSPQPPQTEQRGSSKLILDQTQQKKSLIKIQEENESEKDLGHIDEGQASREKSRESMPSFATLNTHHMKIEVNAIAAKENFQKIARKIILMNRKQKKYEVFQFQFLEEVPDQQKVLDLIDNDDNDDDNEENELNINSSEYDIQSQTVNVNYVKLITSRRAPPKNLSNLYSYFQFLNGWFFLSSVLIAAVLIAQNNGIQYYLEKIPYPCNLFNSYSKGMIGMLLQEQINQDIYDNISEKEYLTVQSSAYAVESGTSYNDFLLKNFENIIQINQLIKDSINDVNVFQNQILVMQKLDPFQVYLFNNDLLKQLKFGNFNQDNFYSLLQNYPFFSKLVQKHSLALGEKVNEIILYYRNLVVGLISSAIVILILILPVVVPFQRQIMILEEAILKLLAKQTVYETDILLTKLKEVKNILQSQDNHWRQFDFITCIQSSSTTQNNGRQKGDDTGTNNNTNTNQQDSQKKYQKDSMLISQIGVTDKKIKNKIIFSVLLSFVTTLFFSILLIWNFQLEYDLREKQIFLMTTLNSRIFLNSFIINQEIIATGPLYDTVNYPSFSLNFETLHSQSGQFINGMNEFKKNFLTDLIGSQSLNDNVKDSARSLINGNLCDYLIQNNIFCDEYTEQNMQEGIQGIFAQFYSIYLGDTQLESSETQSRDFLRSKDHITYLINGIKNIDFVFLGILNLFIDACNQSISEMRQFYLIYFFIVGFLITFFLLVFSLEYLLIESQKIRSLIYLLTFIPYYKLSDDSVLQILKNILQY